MARSHGLECRRLTWDPNYKGIDDWQLAMRKKKEQRDVSQINFRTRFVCGFCSFDAISRIFDAPRRRWMRPAATVLCISIVCSTVLLKQHSCIDVLLGILLAMVIDTAATTLEHSDSRILQRS